MGKLGDKQKGTIEDAAAFLTCTELFFVLLSIEFIIIYFIPVKVSPYVLGGIALAVWYYTNYVMRNRLKAMITGMKIRQQYVSLDRSVAKNYLILGGECKINCVRG